MRLYCAPQHGAPPRWLLEEIGTPYEVVELNPDERPDGFISETDGPVWALVDANVTVYQPPAICRYLADRFAERRLAPDPGSPDRTQYDQWMVYAIATLEPPLMQLLHPNGSSERKKDAARLLFHQRARVIEQALEGRRFILGDREEDFSAADVMLASLGVWARDLGLLTDHANFSAYVVRLTARPAYGRANA